MSVSPALAWFLVGIACYVIELVLPGFILFFFGIGAWCVSLVVLMTDVSLSTQLLVFLICSLVTLGLLRSWLRSVFLGGARSEDDSVTMDQVAATGIVMESILPPAEGLVRYGGSFWRAVADEKIVKNTVVSIEEKKDLIVKVRKLSAAEEEQHG